MSSTVASRPGPPKPVSLSEYLLQELRDSAALPTPEEFQKRLRARSTVVPSVSIAEAVRQERDSR